MNITKMKVKNDKRNGKKASSVESGHEKPNSRNT